MNSREDRVGGRVEGCQFFFSEDNKETRKENSMPPTPILAPCPHQRVKWVRKSPFILRWPPRWEGQRSNPSIHVPVTEPSRGLATLPLWPPWIPTTNFIPITDFCLKRHFFLF